MHFQTPLQVSAYFAIAYLLCNYLATLQQEMRYTYVTCIVCAHSQSHNVTLISHASTMNKAQGGNHINMTAKPSSMQGHGAHRMLLAVVLVSFG